MIISYLHKIIWFAGLLLLQALILNNVHVAGYATPFLYIYFILKLDASMSRNGLLMWGFFLGLAVDVFSNTPGVNTAATVLLAFTRTFYMRMFVSRDDQDFITPSIRHMGFSPFLKYVFAAVFTHHLVLFCLLFYSFVDIPALLIRIISSTVLSVVCILAIDSVRK